MQKEKSFKHDESGYTITEALITAGLIAILIAGVTTIASQYVGHAKDIQTIGDKLDLRHHFNMTIDCDQTFTAAVGAQCKGKSFDDNVYVQVIGLDGNVLIGSAGNAMPVSTYSTGISDYKVRASCADLGGFMGLRLEAKREDTVKVTHNLSTDWDDIKNNIPFTCPMPPLPADTPKEIEFANLWTSGDEGSYMYLNLDTGNWEPSMLTVYNPDYDSTLCQDYMGMQGDFNIIDINGNSVTQKVFMEWRFKPDCLTTPKRLNGTPAHVPGTWGPNINVSKTLVQGPSCGNGTVKVAQVGRYVRFDVWESSCHKVHVQFSH